MGLLCFKELLRLFLFCRALFVTLFVGREETMIPRCGGEKGEETGAVYKQRCWSLETKQLNVYYSMETL